VRLVRSCLYEGQVVHERRTPVRHLFRYGVYMWLVDLDELDALDRRLWAFGSNRRAVTTIRSRDHLGDPRRPIRANVDAYLRLHGIDLEGGAVQLLTNARVLGYVFNPLSVFYCHGPDGDLRCVVAEVHNTHGERHCYLLETDSTGRASVPKAFYVSPFNDVDGQYRMKLPAPDERLAVSIVLERDGHRPFIATMDGERHPATIRNILAAAVAVPAAPLLVSALIRIQGVKLWAKRLPVVKKPHHPSQEAVQ